MKNYVIMKNKDNEIISVNQYDEKYTIDAIREKIQAWPYKDRIPELVEDKKSIEILNFYFKDEDNEDLQNKCIRLEMILADISHILNKY